MAADLDNPPTLRTSSGFGILNFRDYYYTDTRHTARGSNHNQINITGREYEKFPTSLDIVKEVLKGNGITKENFSEEEVRLCAKWLELSQQYLKNREDF